MTTHTPRARLVHNIRVLRRADEVIGAAARVFAERGYHGTTTQAIADVLGMRQASLYYYFPSKEAALEEVCARGTDGFVEAAERVMREDMPPLKKLELLIASHLAQFETMPDYVRVFINERRYLPDASRKRVGRKSRRIERMIEEVIQAGIDSGSIRPGADAHLAMLAVLGMCNAVINWREVDRGRDTRRIAAIFAQLVANGLARNGSPPKHRGQPKSEPMP
ncbi:MAG: TetR family transcriptional regulator [Hyphomicrobiaceae bacterium]|nr:TetR family transcriptional regulator [Hyphomicrobiaceae bacterium]